MTTTDLHKRRRRRKRKPKQAVMTQAMVDRLFWRAGFGASPANRAKWTGKPASALVDWFLSARPALVGATPTREGNPLDPNAEDVDLVLEWVDKMVRTTNPFVERMTFFWHRHFANGRDGGPSSQMLRRQNDLFRQYADFGKNPTASFRHLLQKVTVDPSMLRYLTGEYNVKGDPNENYAREVMELFVLGVRNDQGKFNYTEPEVRELSKAFTGWEIDESNPDAPTSHFTGSRWYNGPKTVFGVTQNLKAFAPGDAMYSVTNDAVELVLRRPARAGDPQDAGRKPYDTHARYLIRKLWHEFIVTPPDAKTLADLVATYLAPVKGKPGLLLKPVIRKILLHKSIFESLDEPHMVKPPVVYVVGMMRALGVHITDSTPHDYLAEMGQLPYNPPNVSGWEGGLSWLNTNTVLSRFSYAGVMMDGTKAEPKDTPGETSVAATKRALAAIGQPWVAGGTLGMIQDYAARAPSGSAALRIERQLMIRALALAGPDAQVM